MKALSMNVKLAQTEKELSKTVSFIAERFFDRFRTKPLMSQFSFAAFMQDEVVGAMGLDFHEGGNFMPFESLYVVPEEEISEAKLESSAQYGRWAAVHPGASVAVAYVATLYAISQGKEIGWCVAKEGAAMRMRKLGIKLFEVSGAKLRENAIPSEDLAYYSTAPIPKLYSMALEQARDALSRKIVQFVKSGEIICESYAHKDESIAQAIEQTRLAYEDTAKMYDVFSRPFHGAVIYPRIISFLLEQLGDLINKKILDAGCGSGSLLQVLGERGAGGVGIDITPAFVAIARSRNLEVVQASMHRMPFEDGCFDCVVSNYALNYLPKDGQELAIKEKFRVLKNGGVLVFSYMPPFFMRASRYLESAPHYPSSVDDYFQPARKKEVEMFGKTFTLYLLDWPEIATMVAESGFRIKKLVDAEAPNNIEEIAAAVGNEDASRFLQSFRYNPYAIFVIAIK